MRYVSVRYVYHPPDPPSKDCGSCLTTKINNSIAEGGRDDAKNLRDERIMAPKPV